MNPSSLSAFSLSAVSSLCLRASVNGVCGVERARSLSALSLSARSLSASSLSALSLSASSLSAFSLYAFSLYAGRPPAGRGGGSHRLCASVIGVRQVERGSGLSPSLPSPATVPVLA